MYIQVPGDYGAKMMIPEEDCIWTYKDGKLLRFHILGSGYCLMEFEGLEGTLEERIQQVEANRETAKSMKKKNTFDWVLDN